MQSPDALPTPAAFVVLDGLDGGGKTTQCRLLAEWLGRQNWQVTTCVDPGGTAVGSAIRELLLHGRHEMTLASEAFLFMASRAQLTAEVIRPALRAGHVVVSDRYLLATVVYQGHGGGLDPDLLWAMGALATGGLSPALTLVLDLPEESARARRKGPADRVERRDAAYYERVRNGFLVEAQRDPDHIQILDARRSIDEIHRQVCEAVQRVLASHVEQGQGS